MANETELAETVAELDLVKRELAALRLEAARLKRVADEACAALVPTDAEARAWRACAQELLQHFGAAAEIVRKYAPTGRL